MNVQSWGRITNLPHHTQYLTNRLATSAQIKDSNNTIAFGMGRSYGDACLNPNGGLWLTRSLDKYISFDDQNGILECECGVLLKDIQRLFVPKGWMLPVSPGTQMITVGGAIANDVHGKNHHVFGSFADSLINIQIQRTTGEIINCGPYHQQEWFAATVGGIGLTGLILKATIQLRPVQSPWLNTETIAYESLEEFFELADNSEHDWEHTVSWIDCLSTSHNATKNTINTKARGLFMRGNHALITDKNSPLENNKKFPFTPPVSLVNNLSLQLFNKAYFAKGKYNAGQGVQYYEKFFYPLDGLQGWNRMYGPKGFYQYQCVIPREQGLQAVKELLNQISMSGSGSFLAVLKTFGNRPSLGMLSFPMPGVTLALDFPNHNEVTLQLLNRLDAVVKQAGGRIYLAKDARMSKEMFEHGYSKYQDFIHFRDPGISSLMSKRLMGY
jgi:FAD/FMN-containing dehydrogenase